MKSFFIILILFLLTLNVDAIDKKYKPHHGREKFIMLFIRNDKEPRNKKLKYIYRKNECIKIQSRIQSSRKNGKRK